MKQTIIQQIKNGDESTFFELYQNYRNIFIKSAVPRFGCTVEEAKDVFQDIMCIFHQNIMNGQLQILTVRAEEYLWKVGSYHLINLKKRQKRGREIVDSLATHMQHLTPIQNKEQDLNLLLQLIRKLRPKDQKLLELRYYRNYCMDAITRELGYRNSQVTRNRKRKILQKLALAFKAKKKNAQSKAKQLSS